MPFLRALLPVVALATIARAQYPEDLFLPAPMPTDSISIRSNSTTPGYGGRRDIITTRKDAQGRPLRQICRTSSQSVDSAVFDYEWNLPVVVVGQGWAASVSRYVTSQFSKGVRVDQAEDQNLTTIWDPAKRTLITLREPAKTGCPWQDSIQLDDRNRVTCSSECGSSWTTTGTDTLWTASHDVFRAWYDSPTDTLPRRASEWRDDGTNRELEDSVFTVGPANRPDTLRGSEIHAVIRDGSGRVLKLLAPDGSDSTTFAYDAQGRLTMSQNASGYCRTYFYSWSDDVGVRRPANSGSSAVRIAGDRLLLSLPLAGTVHVEAVAPSGAHRVLLDGFRPSGASSVPVEVRAGEIVRVRAPGIEGSVRAAK